MKKRNYAIVMSLLLAFTISFAHASDHILKKDISKEWIAQSQTVLEAKEAYKVDDAEYTGSVISKSNLGSYIGFGSEGIALLGGIALLVGLFKRNPLVTCLGLFALATIFYSNPDASVIMAVAPFAIKLKKDGLTGEELKFMNDLEKRFEDIELKGIVDEAKVKEMQTKAFEEAFEPYKKLKDLKIEQLSELLDEKTGFKAIALKQADEINKLKAGGGAPEDMSIKSQVAKWMEENKEAIEQIKGGKQASLQGLKLKVAITMTDSASLNSSPYLPRVLPLEMIDLVRTPPTFWDGLRKESTKLNPYIWMNKTNKQGNAEFLDEGDLRPLASFELDTETSTPKEVGERMKASRNLLFDVDSMTSFIENELRFEVDVACNTAVLTGDGNDPNPTGVTNIASAYVQTGIATINPTYFDAIRACIAQLRVLNFNNVKVYISPVDGANMDMSKANDSGVYVLPPFTTADGRTISGVQVIEDNNIAPGYILAGDFTKYRIMMYQDFFVEWGFENDDFSRRLITVIGQCRFHQWVSENHLAAFIYDTFSNVATAITA